MYERILRICWEHLGREHLLDANEGDRFSLLKLDEPNPNSQDQMSERARGISPCATPRRAPSANVQIAFGIPKPVLFTIHIGAMALWQKGDVQ